MAITLTDAKLKAMKPPTEGQAELSDSVVPGLRVRMGKGGTQTFIVRKRIGGRLRNVTVGRFSVRFTLADARKKARELLSDIEAGRDPAPAPGIRRQTKGILTIRSMLPDFIESKSHLRSVKRIERCLTRDVMPVLGDRMIDTITRGDITRMLDDIAKTAPVQARLTCGYLSSFYGWALPRCDRLQFNPCRDAGRPPAPKARDRVLSDAELATLWELAEIEPLPWSAGVKLLILTGQRRNEVFEADRAEFDLKARVWTIPPERAKNGERHIFPLSGPAMALIKALPVDDDSEKLFAARGRLQTGPSGFSKLLARLRVGMIERCPGGRDWRLHDIRRTVATGMQRSGVRLEVTEAVLNHISGSRAGIVGVYQRYNYAAEKREALEAWAAFVLKAVKAERSRKTKSATISRAKLVI